MTAHIDTAARPADPSAPRASTPPSFVFLPLFSPFGISSGYVSVTLAFLLSRAGMSTLEVTTIVAGTIWVQTWKVLWAPIVDTVGNPKLWYGLGAIGVGASILAMSVLPATAANVPAITLLALVSSAASTLVSMSSEIFMAQSVPAEMRGRASGWAQAGNVGGSGIGGGIGLLLAEHVTQQWVSGAVLAAICFACWGCVRLVPAARRTHSTQSYVDELKGVVRDVWDVARSRVGYLALILMVLPIASGAAPWSAIAGEWSAGADLVALVNGVVGGLASAAGALVGGYICDRMQPRPAYCLFGFITGAVRRRDGLVGAHARGVRRLHARLFGRDRLRLRGVFGDRAGGDRPAVGSDELQPDVVPLQRADRADDHLRRLGPRPLRHQCDALRRARLARRDDRRVRGLRDRDEAEGGYSILMFASLITLPHLAISARTYAANSSGPAASSS